MRLWEGIRRVLDVSRKRLSGRANGSMTGIGVWKDPTRDHRLHLRGARGRRKNVNPPESELSLRRLRVGICRRNDFIIVFLDSSPKREHFKPPILISRHEHFFSYRLVDTSRRCRLFHSHLLFFPTRFFFPFCARFFVFVVGFPLFPLS